MELDPAGLPELRRDVSCYMCKHACLFSTVDHYCVHPDAADYDTLWQFERGTFDFNRYIGRSLRTTPEWCPERRREGR